MLYSEIKKKNGNHRNVVIFGLNLKCNLISEKKIIIELKTKKKIVLKKIGLVFRFGFIHPLF